MQALGPRKIPTAAGIQEELDKLRLDEEQDSDEEQQGDRYLTALANNPSDYFGMIG